MVTLACSDVFVDSSSLDNAARVLRETASDLQTGQLERFLIDRAQAPRSHPELAAALRLFGEPAHDRYRDLIALLMALAGRVHTVASNYRQADDVVAESFRQLLTDSHYRPAPGVS